MKTHKTLLLLFLALVVGISCSAQTKYEKAQQGINTLVSIKETFIGGNYFKVSLSDLTVISTGVKTSSVKIEYPYKHYVGYIDKPELAGLISALKKMQKMLTDNPDNNTTYVYRLTGDMWFYSKNSLTVYMVFDDGYVDVNFTNLIQLLEAAKNGTPLQNE